MTTDYSLNLIRRTAAATCLLALAIHAAGIRRQPVQVDEFEHVHAAWLVSQRQTPYVSYFEHHTPLFYYLGAPFLSGGNPDFDTILNLRFLALGFSVAMTAVGWLWLRRQSRVHGLLAICLLASNSTLASLGHTIFLDTFSAPLLVSSAFLIAGGERKPRWMLGSGVCFGLAVLFNVKASMAMFAPMLLMSSRVWVARSDPARRRAWFLDTAAYLAGGLVSIVFVMALLGQEGSVGMWRYVVEANLGWKARQSGVPTLLGIVWRELFEWFVALALVAYRLGTLSKRGFALQDRDVPWLFLGSMLAGVFLLPVVWMEYFGVLVPFVALTGAMALGDWFSLWHGEASRAAGFANSRFGRYSVHVLALFGFLAMFPYRAFFRSDPFAYVQTALMLVLCRALWRMARRECHAVMALPVALCLTLAAVVPIVRVGTILHRSDNSEQRAHVEYVLANTRPDEPVFDGYTGYGVFRPHAYFFWMIHQEVQAMLPERDKGERLVAALEAKRPKLAIADDWVGTLPRVVHDYLAEHYEATPFAVVKRRKAGVDAAGLVAGGR